MWRSRKWWAGLGWVGEPQPWKIRGTFKTICSWKFYTEGKLHILKSTQAKTRLGGGGPSEKDIMKTYLQPRLSCPLVEEIQSSRATSRAFFNCTCLYTYARSHVWRCILGGCTWRPKADIQYLTWWISTLYVEMCVSHWIPEVTNVV